MRAIVQRVSEASVRVDGETVGQCGRGLLLLVGVHRDDTEAEAAKLADKIVNLRIFNDEAGKMNLSLLDLGPEAAGRGVLAISNFTVYGDASSRRPSFTSSAPYERARSLFDHFVELLREKVEHVGTGVFGVHMDVSLVNDGPVTLVVDAARAAPGG